MERIGICRALHTYHHYALWKTFFEGMGFVVTLSSPTNKEIVENGVRLSPAELCLPVKVFLGHVESLHNRVEKMFLPRLVCQRLNGDWFFGCPKAIALPDLTRAIFPALSDTTVELIIDQRLHTEADAFREVARKLGRGGGLAQKAFQAAQTAGKTAEEKTRQTDSPEHMFDENFSPRIYAEPNFPKIGVLGHPYLLFDNGINLGLWNILAGLKIMPVVPFPDKNSIAKEAENRRNPNWYYELAIIAGVRRLLQVGEIAGLLLVSSFSCGTAAVVNEIIRRELTHGVNLPVLTVLLDEHTAEAGLRTRLESFVEIVRRTAVTRRK